MPVRSVSFDDDSDEELCVFSGGDLLLAHYDLVDLDWGEIAERSLIDERRGLVITQVVAIEDLIDEFILYLADPMDPPHFRDENLSGVTIGPRLGMLEKALRSAQLLDNDAAVCLSAARAVVARRNRLAHGAIECRPTRVVPIADLAKVDLEVEWVLIDRRSGETERISMAELRQDVYDAIGVFTSLLAYAESFVERAPAPEHFAGGRYLGAPTP